MKTSTARRARPSTAGAHLRGFEPKLGLEDFEKCTACVPCTCPQPPRAKRHHCLNTCENATCTACRGLGMFCTRAPNVWIRDVDDGIERSFDDGATWTRVTVSSRPSLFVNAAFRVTGSDAARAAERDARATTRSTRAPAARQRAIEHAVTEARSKVKRDAWVASVRCELGVSDARTITDAERIMAQRKPRRAIGRTSTMGRPRSDVGELFYEIAAAADFRVASLVRCVFAHLVDAPGCWAFGKRAKDAAVFEDFARRTQRILISQRAHRNPARARSRAPCEAT